MYRKSVPDATRQALAALVTDARLHVDVATAAHAVSALAGDRIEVGDASAYVFHRARAQGYDIPPYPLAGCGEIRQFFRDEGVRDVPDWYVAKLGLTRDEARRLYGRTLVAVRSLAGDRTAWVLDGRYHIQDQGFRTLAGSAIIDLIDGPRGKDAALQELTGKILKVLQG